MASSTQKLAELPEWPSNEFSVDRVKINLISDRIRLEHPATARLADERNFDIVTL